MKITSPMALVLTMLVLIVPATAQTEIVWDVAGAGGIVASTSSGGSTYTICGTASQTTIGVTSTTSGSTTMELSSGFWQGARDLGAAKRVVAEQSRSVPTFVLHVAPNPSSGDRRVELTLAEESSLRLEVVDTRGGVCLVLCDGEMRAGTHRFEIPERALAAGAYYVRGVCSAGVGVVGLVVR
jgi:hypothetical protein